MDFKQILETIEQYKELLGLYAEKNKINNVRGHINITGGEPFFRKDFLDILNVFSENQHNFTYGILTNGTYINKENIKKLKSLKPKFIQVSIEGDEETHNSIRGKGNFERTVQTLKLLNEVGMQSMISFTAHRDNYKSFPVVCDCAKKYKVSKLWTDRLVPIGNGAEYDNKLLSPEETMDFFGIIQKEKGTKPSKNTTIAMERSLQFLKGDETPYSCSAGKNLITLMENGDVFPCRRMPIPTDNIFKTEMKDIFYNHPVFIELRKDRKAEGGCAKCNYYKLCEGGDKCISYALTGNPNSPDPGCPIAFRKD